MGKEERNVYIPSGLIASMFNLYGGSGKPGESLNTYDVQLICSYLEYYYNFSVAGGNRNFLRFYTLPHFYNSNPNDRTNMAVKAKEKKMRQNNMDRAMDDENALENGELFKAYQALHEKKFAKVQSMARAIISKLSPEQRGDGSDPASPYDWGISLERDYNFRIKELYEITRYTTEKLFKRRPCTDMSIFFLFKPEWAGARLTAEEFKAREEELKTFLMEYFSTDCYKCPSSIKIEDFAPDVNNFIDCFKKAVKAYANLGIIDLNREYLPAVNSSIASDKSRNLNYRPVRE